MPNDSEDGQEYLLNEKYKAAIEACRWILFVIYSIFFGIKVVYVRQLYKERNWRLIEKG